MAATATMYAKTVNTIRLEPIVIDAKLDFTGHVENFGMIRMFANVSQCTVHLKSKVEINRLIWFISKTHSFYTACNCDAFSLTGNCTEETGQCECKIGYYGANCATCTPGFIDYPHCKPCNVHGTDINQSTPNECSCKPNFTGKFCDECICNDFKNPYCNGMYFQGFVKLQLLLTRNIKKWKIFFFSKFYLEIDRIKSELAKVEDMTNFINCRSNDFGLSFLHVAAMHNLTATITELVKFGSDVDSVDRIEQTPIVYGIGFGKSYKIGNQNWLRMFDLISSVTSVAHKKIKTLILFN